MNHPAASSGVSVTLLDAQINARGSELDSQRLNLIWKFVFEYFNHHLRKVPRQIDYVIDLLKNNKDEIDLVTLFRKKRNIFLYNLNLNDFKKINRNHIHKNNLTKRL